MIGSVFGWRSFPEISFVILKVPSLAYGRNFPMTLSPWHLNSCLKLDSVTQEIIFLGLASVTHFLRFFFFFFFLNYKRHYLSFKEFIDKITYGCKTCLILVLKYHFEDYHKLQILIIIISMVASEKKKLISKIQPPSLPGVPRPHYRDHM